MTTYSINPIHVYTPPPICFYSETSDGYIQHFALFYLQIFCVETYFLQDLRKLISRDKMTKCSEHGVQNYSFNSYAQGKKSPQVTLLLYIGPFTSNTVPSLMW